ncbi:hypothetical protein [Arthrobacter caoxuetaonis]|uniref:Uncharacterized protein n=1 Tax=Arthrobacter caoxuetaonis TaxID=2886935 RepID=A0A9X1MG21_9MICC|nr:hypothetical protein [Arthrobacter caoxuetaonis]MCC3299166.1 hypothetical protein [Arthrobacter caoxuetaonis]USQ58507.1 hypothetical protein NF551_06710 [Arthrobacter caoxuetaonis]
MKKLLALACSAAVLAAVAGCGSGDGTSPGSTPSATQSSSSASSSAAPATTASPAAAPSETPAIAEGFPEALLPLYAGSEATASSFAEDSELLTASLTATSTAAPEEIISFYVAHFEAKGFTALEGESVDSTPTKDLARTTGEETETVNVSVVTRDGESVYTVGANVLPATAE